MTMQVIYAKEVFPKTTTKSVFLAGPTPRDKSVASWRPNALRLLEEAGYDGVVYVPEPKTGEWSPDGYEAQVSWEEAALKRADCIVFWVPRDMATMPALTTNVEWGTWHDSGKVVFGAPKGAPSVKYLQHYASKLQVPQAHTLKDTLGLAVAMVGTGATRTGGECEVPIALWRNASFQSWLLSQKAAGNRLDGCDLLWSFRVDLKHPVPFAWVAHVNVFVAAEDRNKANEFVFGRTDVAGVVMFQRPREWHTMPPGEALLHTKVVVVKEFRSPALTADGFVWELPCGSSKDSEESTLQVALHEVEEEAGVRLAAASLRRIGCRQLAGTLSVHQATAYGVELTDAQMAEIERTAGTARGVEQDTERTYAHVFTVHQLLSLPMTDWSTLGMVTSALL